MRFIRKNGRIIPIREESGGKKIGAAKGAAVAAAAGAAAKTVHESVKHFGAMKHAEQIGLQRGANYGKATVMGALKRTAGAGFSRGKIGKVAAAAAAVGAVVGSVRFAKAKKGESNKALALRLSKG